MAEHRNLAGLLGDLTDGLRQIFLADLRKTIMYGSYARGDNVEGSDLDIMVLVDQPAEEIEKRQDQVLELAVDLATRHGIVISIIEKNYKQYYEWVEVIPFLVNIEKEGICVYERKL